MEQCLRMLIDCGLPASDVNFINSNGPVMNELLLKGNPRNTLFTGYIVLFCLRNHYKFNIQMINYIQLCSSC